MIGTWATRQGWSWRDAPRNESLWCLYSWQNVKKNLTHLPNIFLEENIWKKAMFINIPLVFNIPFIFH
jgi:hypothetical protein